MDEIYFMGIIDILTPYNLKKKMENFFKGLRYDKVRIISPSRMMRVY
jgi:1-phosphatidylinositol-4-phosphate 5-kinase